MAEIAACLLHEARAIHEEDRAMCRAIGEHGAKLLSDGQGVLTHCNAGGLATAEYGTALAVLFVAAEQGKRLSVYADETRPLLQGARLTAWELQNAGLDVTLICDSMAAQVMREGRIQAVITGADRIAANGDSANKIGTYGVAVLAAAPQDSVLHCSAHKHVRSDDCQRRRDTDRAARRPRDHARFRPADRTGRREGLQSGLRCHARRIDRGDYLRARRDPAGDERGDCGDGAVAEW